MKKINYISLLITCLAVFSACDESEFDYENLFPEEYQKILYINKEGIQEMVLYNTGEEYEYSFSVYQGGSEPTLTASTAVQVMTQEEVDNRYGIMSGIPYTIIPDECFTLKTPQLDFSAEDQYKFINIGLITEKIGELKEMQPDKVWVLPIKLASQTDSINESKDHVMFNFIDVLTPSVGFGEITGVDSKILYSDRLPAEQEYRIPLQLDVPNRWDIDCELVVLDEQFVAEYNAKNNTTYELLPAGWYEFDHTPSFVSTEPTLELTLKVETGKLDMGRYILPIRVQSVSFLEPSETNGTYLLGLDVMGPLLSKSGWTVTASSEEAGGEGDTNGYATALIDGNLATFWHSKWQGGTDALPYEIVIDMKSNHKVGQIGLAQRQNNRYVSDFELSLSTDNQNWTTPQKYVLANEEGMQVFHIPPGNARYVKVLITGSRNEPHGALGEIDVYGL